MEERQEKILTQDIVRERGWDEVRELVIPEEENFTKIGKEAFKNNMKIRYISIPKTISEINPNAFYYCSNLSVIHVDDSNKHFCSIDGVLFNKNRDTLILFPRNYKETEYNIPDGVTTIWDGAFSCCYNLKSVNIPDSIETIDRFAFQFCGALSTIYVPETVKNIEYKAFYLVNNVEYHGDLSTDDFGSKCVNGYSEGQFVFKDSSKRELVGVLAPVGDITIPDSVTTIVNYTFYNCDEITSVIIPKSTTIIGTDVFHSCNKLSVLYLTDQIKKIESDAVFLCDNLKYIFIRCGKVSNDETEANIDGIYDKLSLYGVTIKCVNENYTHKHLTQDIVKERGWDEVEELVIPEEEGFTTIERDAFSQCTKLKQITIPEGIWMLSTNAFCRSGLENIKLPNSLEKINDYCFDFCYFLNNIEIPENVDYISYDAFIGCPRLKSISVDKNNKHYYSKDDILFSYNIDEVPIDNVMIGNGEILMKYPPKKEGEEYSIPNNITAISNGAFYENEHLKKLNIPSSVEHIGSHAFQYMEELQTLILPDSVDTIGSYLIPGCKKLEKVICFNEDLAKKIKTDCDFDNYKYREFGLTLTKFIYEFKIGKTGEIERFDNE